jgi:hypothetical protein
MPPSDPLHEPLHEPLQGAGESALTTERFSYTRYCSGSAGMLYALEKDPDGNVNLAGRPEYKPIAEVLADLLKGWQEKAQQSA